MTLERNESEPTHARLDILRSIQCVSTLDYNIPDKNGRTPSQLVAGLPEVVPY